MSKKPSKPDGAARIAEKYLGDTEFETVNKPDMIRDIRRLVARKVRKERERCVQIVRNEHADRIVGARGEGAWTCENILREITETTP